MVVSVESSEGNGTWDALSEVSEDGDHLVGLSIGEAGVMGQVVNQDEKGVADGAADEVGSQPKLPGGEILDEVDHEDLEGDEEGGEPEGVGVVFHESLDFGVLVENELSSCCVGLVVFHEVEVLGITGEFRSGVSIWEGLGCWDVD